MSEPGDLPSWEDLRSLMLRTPKPPLAATAYAIGKPTSHVALPDEGPVWGLSALDPSRFATLASANGSVEGRERLSGRSCVVAEVHGLRGTAPVRIWVDETHGCILRIERADDPAPLLVLDELRIGADAS